MPVNKNPDNIKPDEIFPLAPGSHLGIVVKDMDNTIQTLSSVFGLGPWVIIGAKFDMAKMPYKVALAKMDKVGLGNLSIEVIQPIQEGTLYADFLKAKGEGIHHIASMVTAKDWGEMVANLEKQGAKKLASGMIDPDGAKWAYFENQTGGVIIELIDDAKPDWDAAGATVRMG